MYCIPPHLPPLTLQLSFSFEDKDKLFHNINILSLPNSSLMINKGKIYLFDIKVMCINIQGRNYPLLFVLIVKHFFHTWFFIKTGLEGGWRGCKVATSSELRYEPTEPPGSWGCAATRPLTHYPNITAIIH